MKIDWWIVFLYGGGIALGTLAFKTGLAEAIGRVAHRLLGVHVSAFGLIALSTALATLLSETTSNTAAANMVVPVVIAFARSAGIDPVLPAIGRDDGRVARLHAAGLDAVQRDRLRLRPHSAARAMMRHGIVLDVVGVVVIVTVLAVLGPLVIR